MQIRHSLVLSMLTPRIFSPSILQMSEINVTKFVVTYRDSEDFYRDYARSHFDTRKEADAFWAHLLTGSEDFEPVNMERVTLLKVA